jgi:hypothetical protein
MTILTGTLGMGRTWAEARMTDTCQIGTVSTDAVLNEETGEYESTFTPVYDGICEFKAPTTAAGEINAAGQLLVEQDAILKLPVATSTDVAKDMEVRVTGSLTDPGLPGTVARIKGPAVGSYTTARRFSVEVTSG